MGKIEIRSPEDFKTFMSCKRCGSKVSYSKIKWILKKKVVDFKIQCSEKKSHKDVRTLTIETLLNFAPDIMITDFFNELKENYRGRGIDSYPNAKVRFIFILRKFKTVPASQGSGIQEWIQQMEKEVSERIAMILERLARSHGFPERWKAILK